MADRSRRSRRFELCRDGIVAQPGAKVKMTLEIEADAPGGFDEADIGVVRDNAKQLKFSPGSTRFSD